MVVHLAFNDFIRHDFSRPGHQDSMLTGSACEVTPRAAECHCLQAVSATVKLSAPQLASMLTRLGLQLSVHRLLQSAGQQGGPFAVFAQAAQPAKEASAAPPSAAHLFAETEGGFGAVDGAEATRAAEARRLEVSTVLALLACLLTLQHGRQQWPLSTVVAGAAM